MEIGTEVKIFRRFTDSFDNTEVSVFRRSEIGNRVGCLQHLQKVLPTFTATAAEVSKSLITNDRARAIFALVSSAGIVCMYIVCRG